jgi:hypothetical protein
MGTQTETTVGNLQVRSRKSQERVPYGTYEIEKEISLGRPDADL